MSNQSMKDMTTEKDQLSDDGRSIMTQKAENWRKGWGSLRGLGDGKTLQAYPENADALVGIMGDAEGWVIVNVITGRALEILPDRAENKFDSAGGAAAYAEEHGWVFCKDARKEVQKMEGTTMEKEQRCEEAVEVEGCTFLSETTEERYRYLVIGGRPFRGYTQTLTYTSLKVVGRTNDLLMVRGIVEQQYEKCGGLLIALDTHTGKEV